MLVMFFTSVLSVNDDVPVNRGRTGRYNGHPLPQGEEYYYYYACMLVLLASKMSLLYRLMHGRTLVP